MPTFYGASDFRQALRIAGVPVVVGAVSDFGLMDAPDETMLTGELAEHVGKSRTVLVEKGKFALASGGDITVDGVAYKILAFRDLDDGLPVRVAIGTVS